MVYNAKSAKRNKENLDKLLAQAQADLRSLWADRVLDAYAVKYGCDVPGACRTNDPVVVSWFVVWTIKPHDVGGLIYGATPEAARLGAAQAMVVVDPLLDPHHPHHPIRR